MSVSQVASRNNSESLICWFASVAAQITFDKKPSKRIFMDCFKWSQVSIDCLADDSLELLLSSVNVYNKNTLSACYAVVIAGIFWCEQHWVLQLYTLDDFASYLNPLSNSTVKNMHENALISIIAHIPSHF